jgi:4-hydroxy-2-oxoheptanedioate aldolase
MTQLQSRIDENSGILGTFCTLGLHTLELLCQPPMRSCLLDAQHGMWDLNDLRQGLCTAERMQVHPIVRLPVSGHWMIEALLDAGCRTLLFPMVNTVEQVEQLIQACYYPPLGIRSQSTCRASLLDRGDYRHTFNDQFSLLAMIEHIHAVEALPQMLQLPQLTGCFIGPSDLASSLGESNNPQQLEEHVQQILHLCKASQKIVGITAESIDKADQRLRQGFDIVIVSTDRKLLHESICVFGQQWDALCHRNKQ